MKYEIGTLTAYDNWLEKSGVSRTTGWRWRRRGWLHVINISGRNYLPGEEIERFLQRAKSGEFSCTVQPPLRKEVAG